MEKNILVISPLRNEKKNLGKNLLKINKNFHFLVIDDCSNDGSDLFLIQNKIKFIRCNKNIGYEKAVIKGLKYGLKKKYDAIVTIDSDSEHLFSHLKKIINTYKKKQHNLIIGRRKNIKRIFEKIYCFFFFKRFNIHDPLSGLKLYDTSTLKKINLNQIKGLFLTDLLIMIINQRLNYLEINITNKSRKDEPKVGNCLKVNTKIFGMIIKLLFNKY